MPFSLISTLSSPPAPKEPTQITENANMGVVLDEIVVRGAETGRNIRNKRDFEDVAFDVLDNDPNMDSPEFGGSEQAKIEMVKALWAAYKSSPMFKQSTQGPAEDEQVFSISSGGTDPVDVSPLSQVLSQAVDSSEECPHTPGTLAYRLWCKARGIDDDSMADVQLDDESGDPDDELTPSTPEMSGDVADLYSKVEALSAALDAVMGTSTSDAPDVDYDKLGNEMNVGYGGLSRPHQTGYDDEQADVYRQVATDTGRSMRDTLKDIEHEGEIMGTELSLPANPYPAKSPAAKAWHKGMVQSLKQRLGINTSPKPEKRRTRRR